MRQLDKLSIIQILQEEIQALEQKRSTIQLCLRAIKARELCMKRLCEKLEALNTEDEDIFNDALMKCSEILTHLRILTLSVVESVVRWREMFAPFFQFTQKSPFALPYLPFQYGDKNYTLVLRSDCEFLK